MVRNIVIVLILAVIGVPSWQIGMITLQKKKTGYVLQEQVNNIKKLHGNEELIKKDLTKELELLGLPTQFKMEQLEQYKLKITYNYSASASVFGKTYYEVSEIMEKVTKDSTFDSK